MPHTRPRLLTPVIAKSLRFWPAVCLVGPRQVGKSTLLKGFGKFRYRTLDEPGALALAIRNPQAFLQSPSAIDEAQKAPGIFDAVKLDIDAQKKPGKYILTGSVRFSARSLIRESLTGRAKMLELHPMTLAEILEIPLENRWESPKEPRISRAQLTRHLDRGGMPGAFATRNSVEHASYWRSLIDSYVHRDLLLALPKNPKPALAEAVLRAICEILALGELPVFARILRKTGGTRFQAERHLQALEDLMVIRRLQQLGSSPRNDIYLPFDPALFLSILSIEADHDAASHSACLYITLLNEALAFLSCSDRSDRPRYALSSGGQLIHLVMPGRDGRPVFYSIFEEPVPHRYALRPLEAGVGKYGGRAYALTSIRESARIGDRVRVLPWESVL